MFQITEKEIASGETLGPDLWRIQGDALGLTDVPWLVWRLPAQRSALEAFAVFGRAAAAASDVLRAPMAWKRDGAFYYVGSPAPDGILNAHPGKDPVHVWLRLARAVAHLHARGVVHGDVRAHVWPTNSGPVLTGAGLWAAGSTHPTRKDDLDALVLLLEDWTGTPVDDDWRQLPSVDALVQVVDARQSPRPVAIDTAHLVGLEAATNARFGEGLKFRLITPPGAEQVAGAFFWRGAHGPVYESLLGAWDGAELRFDAPHFVKDSEGRTFLTGKADTVPVLEPHWFVSVTDVVKIGACVNRYFVDQRATDLPGKPLVVGNLLHGMLEDLMASDAPFSTLWNARIATVRYAMLSAGLRDADLDGVRTETEAHYTHLRAFARGRDRSDRYAWTGESSEAARYSVRYGLEGRIDVVTEEGTKRLNIVELKTGSVRDEHQDQVQAYRVLWDSYAASKGQAVQGLLIYSREGHVKPVDPDPVRIRGWLRDRNRLVAAHHALATGDAAKVPFYNEFPQECASNACRFRRKTCEAQCRVLGQGTNAELFGDRGLTNDMRTWWRHFTRLVEAEYWAENTAFGESFRDETLPQRVAAGRCLAGLKLAHVEGTRVRFSGKIPTLSAGSAVMLHQGEPTRGVLLRGWVAEVTPDALDISVPTLRTRAELPRGEWYVELVPSRMGLRGSHANLYAVLASGRVELAEVLTGRATWTPTPPGDAPTGLNPEQQLAWRAALHASPGALIQGPPGTGKTTVIGRVIAAMSVARVLVATQTNTALDTVLEKLVDLGVPFLRVGASHRCEGLATRLMQVGGSVGEYFTDDLERSAPSLDALRERLRDVRVVGCTVHSLTSSDAIQALLREHGEVPFDLVIMDEATQITEPLAVGALVKARRFVMVGDQRQLPPVVVSSPDAQVDPSLHLEGLGKSLFERLLDAGAPSVKLSEQYRMNAHIMAFSNRLFYGGELRAAPSARDAMLSVEVATLPQSMRDILDPAAPVVFVDVAGAEDGRVNRTEAEVVAAVAQTLVDLGVARDQIGVVSPFRAQVEHLRSLLAGIDCDTVERFQGSERDVMVFSMVRTDRTGAFITDERRLNVALTRARHKLIVVGHRSCLSVSSLFRELLEQPETRVVAWT